MRRIAALCVHAPGEAVTEIGAGTGTLTRALLDLNPTLTALEVDPALVALLRARGDLERANIVTADALSYDYDVAAHGRSWCAVGNLPYNIASPLLIRWLELRNPPQRIVVMLQRDVAERLTAVPGTPAYGSLTLLVTYHMTARRIFILGPGAFYPKPNVDSAVVVMERRTVPPVAAEPSFLLQVVRGAFAYRRKTLANSLSLALGIERARTQRALAALAIDTEIRAEQLDLDAFGALADHLGT